MVEKIDDYPWSSYLFYTGRRKTPEWLYTTEVLQQLGTHHVRIFSSKNAEYHPERYTIR
jgi:hypothetical protein